MKNFQNFPQMPPNHLILIFSLGGPLGPLGALWGPWGSSSPPETPYPPNQHEKTKLLSYQWVTKIFFRCVESCKYVPHTVKIFPNK